MATDYKPADANKDGKVTPKEREKYKKVKAEAAAAAAEKPKPGKDQQDRITEGEMEKRFKFAKEVVWSNKELRGLWQQAIKEQWTDAQFQSQLRGSDWYRNNAEYARNAWAAEKTGGADWQAQLDEASLKIRDRATRLGASLTDEQAKQYARRYIFEGWGDQARARMMDEALAGQITPDGEYLKGQSGDIQQSLMETARRNGMTMSQDYYQSAARSIAQGLTTEEDWQRQIREQAASKWPTFQSQIIGGIDMMDLASGYINTMAEVFEIDPSSITLDDPYIKSALQGIDSQTGQPATEGLYDFEYRLKSDPRWTGTKQGVNTIASVGMDVLRLMGFQG